jgi:rubrerythrin
MSNEYHSGIKRLIDTANNPIAEEKTPSPIVEFTRNWWHGLLDDKEKLIRFLKRLHQNEFDAEERFRVFADSWKDINEDIRYKDAREVIHLIADQEAYHAKLVEEVLGYRAEVPLLEKKDESKYWRETMPHVHNLETAAAVGAFAEVTALNRFRILVSDTDTPEDLRQIFSLILPDETFHARALSHIAGSEAMNAIRPYHIAGLEALGLRKKT